jgi:thiosulfate reductase cytochrome b subunit
MADDEKNAEAVRTAAGNPLVTAADADPAAAAANDGEVVSSSATAAPPANQAAPAPSVPSSPVAGPVDPLDPIDPIDPVGSVSPASTVSAASAHPAVLAVAPEAPPVAGKRPLVKRHHWLVRLTHWANAILLVGMMGSGLQIYGAYRWLGPRGGPFYPNPWNGKVFPHWATLGGWLAPGLNWHFFLAWPFILSGVTYLLYLLFSGEWRSLLFRPSDVPRAVQMQLYYLHLRRDHPPQGKHNALQKAAYTFILLLAGLSVASGFAVYKPDQLAWLTSLFGGYELARFWHFWAVFVFLAFILVHVSLVLLVDPASLRAMITGWYRGRFPSHD